MDRLLCRVYNLEFVQCEDLFVWLIPALNIEEFSIPIKTKWVVLVITLIQNVEVILI